MISSVRSSSLGEYSCLAKNKFGSDSVELTVVDERKIIVTEPPQYSVLTPGQTAQLRCGGHSALGTVKYQWWKGNTPVEQVGLLQGRVTLGQDGGVSHLELQDVHRDDAGVYLCQLSNEHGQQEVQAEISVLEEAARVVFTPRQVHLRLGEAGTVPCYIRPSFYLATWTRDNSSLYSLTADQASGVIIDGKTGWLEFSLVTEAARGEYRCQAEWNTSDSDDHGVALSHAIKTQ